MTRLLHFRHAEFRGTAVIVSVVAALCLTVAPGAQQNSTPQSGRAAAARPIRALYVTGGGFHEFVKQEAIVPPAMAERVNVTWTIDHTAGKSTEVLIERHKNTDWAKEFDVVLYNMSFSFVVDVPWIERLVAAHRDSGVGAVILHGAVHSYRRSESRAWGELMGAFSLRHDSAAPADGRDRRAQSSDHARRARRSGRRSPRSCTSSSRCGRRMTPLAQAFSIESKKTYPLIWTNTHGKARVFVTSLGHNTEMIANPVYLDLVSRGLLWTVGKLKDDGTPAAGYTGRR